MSKPGLDALAQQHRDPVAAADAARRERIGQPVRKPGEFEERPLAGIPARRVGTDQCRACAADLALADMLGNVVAGRQPPAESRSHLLPGVAALDDHAGMGYRRPLFQPPAPEQGRDVAGRVDGVLEPALGRHRVEPRRRNHHFRIGCGGEREKGRAGTLQRFGERGPQGFRRFDVARALETRREAERGEVEFGVGQGLSTRGRVHAVPDQQYGQIRGRGRADGYQPAHVHEKSAVALDHDDPGGRAGRPRGPAPAAERGPSRPRHRNFPAGRGSPPTDRMALPSEVTTSVSGGSASAIARK